MHTDQVYHLKFYDFFTELRRDSSRLNNKLIFRQILIDLSHSIIQSKCDLSLGVIFAFIFYFLTFFASYDLLCEFFLSKLMISCRLI